MFVVCINMGPYGSKNFKTLLHQQITCTEINTHTYIFFQTSPEFSSQWSSQKYCFGYSNFEFTIFNDFFFENLKFKIVPYG